MLAACANCKIFKPAYTSVARTQQQAPHCSRRYSSSPHSTTHQSSTDVISRQCALCSFTRGLYCAK
eukprot:6892-Heterococcus_DN1.PRE.9